MYVPLEYKPKEVLSFIDNMQYDEVLQIFREYLGISVANIYTTILDVCNKLSINVPYVRLFGSRSDGIPMEARYSNCFDLIELPINSVKQDIISTEFIIAHELRHKWQSFNNISIFEGYYRLSKLDQVIRSNKISSQRILEYNCQPAEMDANAFALHYVQSVRAIDEDEILRCRFLDMYQTSIDRYNYLAEKIKQKSKEYKIKVS